MKNRIILLLVVIIFTSSCSGFGMKRSEKADEFLIKKKSPLVMPPDIEDLPKPKRSNQANQTEDDFEEILNTDSNTSDDTSTNTNSSLTENIIKKIEE